MVGSRASLGRCPPIHPCRALWISTPHRLPSTVTPPLAQRAPPLATLPTHPASIHISPPLLSPQTLGHPLRHTPTRTGLMSPPAPPLWGTPTTHCRLHTTHTFQSRCSCSPSRSRFSRPLNHLSSETCRCLRRPARGKHKQTDFRVLCSSIKTHSNSFNAFLTSLVNSLCLFFIIIIGHLPFYVFFSLHLRKLYSF